jgi:hypothetical protein
MSDKRYEWLLQRPEGGNFKLGKAVQIINGKASDTHRELSFPSI